MQKRARNLATEELLIEVIATRELKNLQRNLNANRSHKTTSIPSTMMFGWGRANRGINFSYVSYCTFLNGFNFQAEVCGLKLGKKLPDDQKRGVTQFLKEKV